MRDSFYAYTVPVKTNGIVKIRKCGKRIRLTGRDRKGERRAAPFKLRIEKALCPQGKAPESRFGDFPRLLTRADQDLSLFKRLTPRLRA